MPDTSTAGQNERVKTPIRTVRVDDELWQRAQEKATRRRETVADVIRRALLAYVGDELEGVHIHSRACSTPCKEDA